MVNFQVIACIPLTLPQLSNQHRKSKISRAKCSTTSTCALASHVSPALPSPRSPTLHSPSTDTTLSTASRVTSASSTTPKCFSCRRPSKNILQRRFHFRRQSFTVRRRNISAGKAVYVQTIPNNAISRENTRKPKCQTLRKDKSLQEKSTFVPIGNMRGAKRAAKRAEREGVTPRPEPVLGRRLQVSPRVFTLPRRGCKHRGSMKRKRDPLRYSRRRIIAHRQSESQNVLSNIPLLFQAVIVMTDGYSEDSVESGAKTLTLKQGARVAAVGLRSFRCIAFCVHISILSHAAKINSR